jgi:hypothetical protein
MVYLMSISGMLSLIVSQYHYSIDVIIAFVLTGGLWTFMRWFSTVDALKYETVMGRLYARIDDDKWPSNYAAYKISKDLPPESPMSIGAVAISLPAGKPAFEMQSVSTIN